MLDAFEAQRFVNANLPLYQRLFMLLGHTLPQTIHLTDLAQRAKALWWGPEHGQLPPLTRNRYTNQQLIAALEVLQETGVYDTYAIPSNILLDRLIFTGAKLPAMHRRFITELHPRAIDSTREIMCSLGERPRKDFDGTLDQIKKLIDACGIAHHPWVQEQLALGNKAFATEFELGILALHLVSGDDIKMGNTELNGAIQRCMLDDTELVFVNGPSVARLVGDDRPTAATTHVFLMRHFPLRADSKVGIVSGGPHTLRVALDAARAMWEYWDGSGFPFVGIEAYAVGSVNPELITAPVNSANDRRPYGAILGLGELARILWIAAGLDKTPPVTQN